MGNNRRLALACWVLNGPGELVNTDAYRVRRYPVRARTDRRWARA
jgi:hypothetical protein